MATLKEMMSERLRLDLMMNMERTMMMGVRMPKARKPLAEMYHEYHCFEAVAMNMTYAFISFDSSNV